MRIIAKKTLREFWEVHADCEEQLKAWYKEMEKIRCSDDKPTQRKLS